jgi:hypothetical protein
MVLEKISSPYISTNFPTYVSVFLDFRSIILLNLQVQDKALLAKGRKTFAKEIQEINEEFMKVGGSRPSFFHRLVGSGRSKEDDVLMLEACSNWAVDNQIWINKKLCPQCKVSKLNIKGGRIVQFNSDELAGAGW